MQQMRGIKKGVHDLSLTTPPANASKRLNPSKQVIRMPSNLGKALLRKPRKETRTIHTPRKMLYFVLVGALP